MRAESPAPAELCFRTWERRRYRNRPLAARGSCSWARGSSSNSIQGAGMKILISTVALLVLAAVAGFAAAPQLASPNEMGVSMGVVHLITPDVAATRDFWVGMGGTAGKLGPNVSAKLSRAAKP